MRGPAVRFGLFLAALPVIYSLAMRALFTHESPLYLAWRAGAVLPALNAQGHDLWRLFTGGLLHLDLDHLVLNALSLLGLGYATARLFGVGRAGLLALVGGLVSCGVVGVFAHGPTVGASGVVFGLLAAGGVGWVRHRPLFTAEPHLGALLLFFGLSVVTVTVQGEGSELAHLSGAAAGALMAWVLRKPIPVWPVLVAVCGLAAWGLLGVSQLKITRFVPGPQMADVGRTVTNGLILVARAPVEPDWRPAHFDTPLGPQWGGLRFGVQAMGAHAPQFLNLPDPAGRRLIWVRDPRIELTEPLVEAALKVF